MARLAAPLTHSLYTGTLHKTGEACALHVMSPAQLDMALALQQQVLADLGDNAFYLVPKSRAKFHNFLASWPLDTIYAATVAGQHAAQIIVRQRVQQTEHARNIIAVRDLHRYALVQGAITGPAFRGRGLLHLMLDYLSQNVLPHLPIEALLARVVPENVGSWHVFMKAGFSIAGAETDPDDERRVFYMVKGLPPKLGETRLVDVHDYDTCQKLCRQGWHGVTHNETHQLLTFQR